MKLFFDILIAIPIGILYNLMILKFGDITNANVPYKIKMQRNLLLAFAGATFAFLLGQFIFNESRTYGNRSIKYGLWLGACILLIHVMLYNWNILENDSKLIIMIITFVMLLLYSYGFYGDNVKNDDENKHINADEEMEETDW
jgi:uncharacterized membrane protein